jgi:hypothetical protein
MTLLRVPAVQIMIPKQHARGLDPRAATGVSKITLKSVFNPIVHEIAALTIASTKNQGTCEPACRARCLRS